MAYNVELSESAELELGKLDAPQLSSPPTMRNDSPAAKNTSRTSSKWESSPSTAIRGKTIDLCERNGSSHKGMRLYPRALAPVRVLLSRPIHAYWALSAPLEGTSRFALCSLHRLINPPLLLGTFALSDRELHLLCRERVTIDSHGVCSRDVSSRVEEVKVVVS